jgi:hypothetical protein
MSQNQNQKKKNQTKPNNPRYCVQIQKKKKPHVPHKYHGLMRAGVNSDWNATYILRG